MPCYDSRPGQAAEDHYRKLTLLTRIACEGFSLLNPSQFAQLSKVSQDWWRQHQEQDRKSKHRQKLEKEQEAQKKKALGKLTKEERTLLGLN